MPCSRRVRCFTAGCGTGVPSDTSSTRRWAVRASRGQDVACGVDVPVVDGAAGAGPLPDVQRRGRADGSAHRARPGRREPPVDPGERAPVPARLDASMPTNVDQPASCTTLPRRVRARPDTARSSTYDRSVSRTIVVDSLCSQSRRVSPTRAWHFATLRRERSRFAEPRRRRASSFCARRSFAAALRAIRGASTFGPSDSTAKWSGPGRSPPRAARRKRLRRELPRRTSRGTAPRIHVTVTDDGSAGSSATSAPARPRSPGVATCRGGEPEPGGPGEADRLSAVLPERNRGAPRRRPFRVPFNEAHPARGLRSAGRCAPPRHLASHAARLRFAAVSPRQHARRRRARGGRGR